MSDHLAYKKETRRGFVWKSAGAASAAAWLLPRKALAALGGPAAVTYPSAKIKELTRASGAAGAA
jgi:hypothetical protein